MIDQIGVLLKSATGEIGTPKAIWKLLYTAIGYVSSFFSFAVLVKDICPRALLFSNLFISILWWTNVRF